ncbi:transcriptional accessory protein Tex/SPT6 [Lentimicrobium saccharophilum]|uniref:Transcriptional accessory protein Tex/SPT6 n=1 Tax=Lentimicrobium saccharophilum TaxID=1678841 RepID=A0A0S7C2L3_9BACT|nr:Tex family protein [Lentimicrobium saccharophilum]GAP43075.1 transcriptional accessory protein Tex/SPT6 [Lentimicrobium saccharophilum]
MTDQNNQFAEMIARELNLQPWQVFNTIKLMEGGATIPFMARYRKEMTGSLDEVQLAAIRDRHQQLMELEKRREYILGSVQEQEKLTPELEKQIREATTLTALEDLYLPYKPKRKTRATIAREKGLEPLAKILMAQNPVDPEEKAEAFIDPEKSVNSAEDALAGARDIIAEWVNESLPAREQVRNLFTREAMISSRPVKGKELEGIHYQNYYDTTEQILRAPSHRILAMFRGEEEGFLRLAVEPAEEKAIARLNRIFLKGDNEVTRQVEMAVKDAYKRLLQPSMETEMRQLAKQKADDEAIKVFAGNLRQLLLAAPLGQKNVLAIDPGFRTGCKLVCLDRQGRLLHNETIYPHPPQNEVREAVAKVKNLVSAYGVEAIAIGNGTAGRETENFIRKIPFDRPLVSIMVNESGASVYSASAVAREEFPEYDVTVRGAVSIGRRLMDPLAELVKIDPKSIGVGQYQHDVNQQSLQHSLEDTVISCVNQVGVELNTASKQLLSYVSGLGPSIAGNIVEHRNKNGAFRSRKELLKVKRFGDKAFEQAAGFLRIRDAENPLDRSAVHPESYDIVQRMADSLGCTVKNLIEQEELRKKIMPEHFVTQSAGLPTINDILQELAKPGRDPREQFDLFEFDNSINSIEDLKPGMILNGIITNITAFGAFVDIGVHQDGLVHVSQMANRFVRDPNEVVKLTQKVRVKVMDVDVARKRISLSMKEAAG